ncbi:MAG: HIT family protein [Roseivirga sp.]
MPSLFTKIINRDLPSHIVAEEAHYMAFLDIHPLALGHTLVVPKQEVDNLFDLEDSILSGLMLFAKRVAIGIQQVVPCLRVGMAVVGLEVPHAHIHLLPLNGPYDIDFKKPQLQLSQAKLRNIAAQLYAAISQGRHI